MRENDLQTVEELLEKRKKLTKDIREIDSAFLKILKRNKKYLGDKRYTILYMRFYEKKSLQEVGKVFGVLSDRIRTIEQGALCCLDYYHYESKQK